MAAAPLLSLQVEESVVAGKLLLASMRRLRPAWHYELKDLLDMEMVGGCGCVLAWLQQCRMQPAELWTWRRHGVCVCGLSRQSRSLT